MSMSIADAIRRYHEIKISVASVGMEPLDEETVDILDRIVVDTNSSMLAGQLAAGLRTLWIARQSGEHQEEDTDAMLCLLAEVASLIENAIEAHDAAIWWQAQHEKAAKAAPTTRRRKAKEAAE